MRVIVTKDYEDLGRVAANIIASQVTLKPESVLGLQQVLPQSALIKTLSKNTKTATLIFQNATLQTLMNMLVLQKTTIRAMHTLCMKTCSNT